MSNIEFAYTPSSTSQSEEYMSMRKKNMHEFSVYSGDSFNITQIFGFISKFYKNISSEQKNTLKTKKEEDITDFIRRDIQKDEDFRYSGFTVNTEARNQSYEVGYYDLKFENPAYWQSKYFVFECKPIDLTSTKIKAYIYTQSKTKGQDGGLYRFFINKYAENLPFGGMLGYVTSNTPEEIITKLKSEIKSLQIEGDINFGNLTDEYLLNMQINDFKHSFQSKHIRINQNKEIITSIHIFHLFLDLTE
ncbi:MAG: hypothetical protein LBS43_05040 [Prevotellaceae bacterium]|nr:hypothetical protein [Prevotellaceae bacterium]